ncbi:hypothetical protein COB64_00320 [Candidatus Wolfebacteria bacterium]|nr:MAG: hypothetical protein COB64_00320 [Candidatus Wolfebacteria bacterium]
MKENNQHNITLQVIIVIIVLIILGILGFSILNNNRHAQRVDIVVSNFDECVAAGNSVMESYPGQCRHGDELFIQNIGNELEKIDIIRINMPRPTLLIESPLVIEGNARGPWFSEGSFPIELIDADGVIIAQGIATVEGDARTEDFVKFSGILEFEKPDSGNKGTLILRKSNPSGEPAFDDALELPILFGK